MGTIIKVGLSAVEKKYTQHDRDTCKTFTSYWKIKMC
jgi:hypothetical protein